MKGLPCGVCGGLRRGAVILLAWLELTAVGGKEPAPPTAGGPPVMLPPLIVEEVSHPLRWRYGRLPGVELLTACDDATSQKFAQRYQRIEELLGVLLPPKFQRRSTTPDVIVLVDTGASVRSKEVLAEMLQREKKRGNPIPNMFLWDSDTSTTFVTLSPTEEDESAGAGTSALYLSRGSAATRASMDFAFEPARIAYLLESRLPALPAWLVAGMLGTYDRIRLGDRSVDFLPAIWVSEVESQRLAADADWPRTLLPMRELFAGAPGENAAAGSAASDLTLLWQAQCALFVRWAVTEQRPGSREALWRFVERLEREAPGEAMFVECFGMGFADMRDRLSDYLPVAVREARRLPASKSPAAPRLSWREPTDAEIARIRGDWERLEVGYVKHHLPSLTADYVAQARRTLHRAYKSGNRDPQFLGVLGLAESDFGDGSEARKFLEAAVRGDAVRPRVYIELAQLRYRAALAAAGSRPLTTAEAGGILELLMAAHRVQPALVQTYALMSDVWEHQTGKPTAAERTAFNEGVAQFPGISVLVFRAIQLNASSGAIEAAIALTKLGAVHATDRAVCERFGRVRAELEAAQLR